MVFIDGMAAGLAAAVLMTLFEASVWTRQGIGGVVEWQVNEVLASRLASEQYVPEKRLGWAVLMHLTHGAVLGGLLSILISVGAETGLATLLTLSSAYSVALWVLVPLSCRKSLERAAGTAFTTSGMAVSLTAHVVYGFALGGLLFLLAG